MKILVFGIQSLISTLPRGHLTNITHYPTLLTKAVFGDYRERYGSSGFAEILIPVLLRWVRHPYTVGRHHMTRKGLC